MAGGDIGETGRGAAIGRDGEVEPGKLVECDGGEIARRAERGGGESPVVRVLARVGDDLGDVLLRQLRRHHQQHRRFAGARDRREVDDRIVGSGFHHALCHHMRAGREQHRIAVGRRLSHGLAADGAAAAAAVIDHDGVTPGLLQLLGEQPREHIDAAASGERNDHADRPVGETARLSGERARQGGCAGCGGGREQEVAALHRGISRRF